MTATSWASRAGLPILIAAVPGTTKRAAGTRLDQHPAADLPTICCTIETSTGASSASA